mmetsp:Transcript_43924/g.127883  ORF Transcript_43924/g.127883 Transcript_43924/m.127883 type:complete len:424 (-) Transcript_43924:27-1298(-)
MELMLFAGLLVVVSAALAALGFRGRDQVVGIDLGTTFSVVALKSGNKVTVLPDHLTGKLLLPSVVTYHPNGSVLVGWPAAELRGDYPSQTIFNAKRFIGRPFDEVAADAAAHPYAVAAGSIQERAANGSIIDDGTAWAGFSLPGLAAPAFGSGDRWVSPIDVGAEVVRHMKESVSRYVGYEIQRAVICVPAKFTWREAKATQDAFERAGFKVARVLEEPTAAAVAYNLHKGSGVRHVLVYDIGGGTLDTSLLYMNGKSISVLGVAGDDHLGGSDFDLRMRDLLLSKLPGAEVAAAGPPPTQRCHSTGMHILGEQAKIELSGAPSTEVRCLADGGRHLLLRVTREEFEEAAKDLFERSMAPVAKVLEDQMMTRDDVQDIVLVGGASRTPKLRALLQEFMGPDKRLHTEIDPDVTVAYGAANILD